VVIPGDRSISLRKIRGCSTALFNPVGEKALAEKESEKKEVISSKRKIRGCSINGEAELAFSVQSGSAVGSRPIGRGQPFRNERLPNFKSLQPHMFIKEIKTPCEVDTRLAELVGAFIGDGTMPKPSNNDYLISISGNSEKDISYLMFLIKLFNELFDINMKIMKVSNENTAYIRFRSKRLCEFFITTFGFSYGPKDNIDIPEIIKSDKELSRACIRGLFDTDGCVTMQRMGKYNYPLVKISTSSYELACSTRDLLKSEGFNVFISRKNKEPRVVYDVVVKNIKQLNNFFSVIGSNNPRNIKKFIEYREKINKNESLGDKHG